MDKCRRFMNIHLFVCGLTSGHCLPSIASTAPSTIMSCHQLIKSLAEAYTECVQRSLMTHWYPKMSVHHSSTSFSIELQCIYYQEMQKNLKYYLRFSVNCIMWGTPASSQLLKFLCKAVFLLGQYLSLPWRKCVERSRKIVTSFEKLWSSLWGSIFSL